MGIRHIAIIALGTASMSQTCGVVPEPSLHRLLAEHYAPAIYQEARSEVLDFITRFDYDGDWNGANNWRNAYLHPMPAYVYYAVIESENHYSVTYAFFHARDYTSRPMEGFAPKMEHENDMEGCTLLVEKDGSPWGKPLLLETLAHDHFYKYVNPDTEKVRAGAAKLDGVIVFLEEDPEGRHREPAIFIEAEGHGVKAAAENVLDLTYFHPGVVYRFAGRGAEIPKDARDSDVSYELLPIEETLWPRRFEVGGDAVYCCADSYRMSDGSTAAFGGSFNGPIGGCAARPPWAWDQRDDGAIAKGDWFRDPIRAFAEQLDIQGLSGSYLHNPYLAASTADTASLPPCSDGGADTTVKQAATRTALGVAQVLLSGGLGRQEIGSKARRLFMSDAVLLEWAGKTGLERWEWDRTLPAELMPSVVTEQLVDMLRIPLPGSAGFASPAIQAPAMYFDKVVVSYKCSVEGAQARIFWTDREMTDFDEAHSVGLALQRSDAWTIAAADLAESPAWDKSRTVTRVKLDIATPGSAPNPPGTSDQVVIRYIILDREAFADTFVR